MRINLTLDPDVFVPKFLPYITDYSHRWELLMGSAGSSKSYYATQKTIIRACSEQIRILVCRRYGTTLRNSVFALYKQILKKWQIMPYVKVNESEMRITFPNGSEIIFVGLDTEEKLLSLTDIGTIFIDEVYECGRDIVEQCNLRMRGHNENQQLILCWNPISKNHWLYDFCQNPPENSLYIHSTYKDNPFLPADYVKSLEELRVRDPQKARVYCDGEWGVITDGLIFKNWCIRDFDPATIKGERICGLDFGYSNDTNALTCSIVDGNNLFIYREWGETHKTNPEIASVIKTMGLSKDLIIADSSEPKSCEELRRAGCRIKESVKGPDSVRHGIQLIQEYNITIHPSCVQTIEEFENYSWQFDKRANTYIDKPVDLFNHHIDSIRYSLQLLGKGQLRTTNIKF